MAVANVLGNYDPIFYANEALIALHNALGMAGRVHRGYDPAPQQKGSVINITAPTVFEATDVNTTNGGTIQDLTPSNVSITLDTWKEVKFALSDKELTFAKEKIIADHITPAAYAIANAIDISLAKLTPRIPWATSITSTPVVTDITGAYQVLFDNGVPMDDLHFMVDGNVQAGLQAMTAFATASGSGQAGVDTQLRGTLGTRYGFEFFGNQNVQSVTSGTAADVTGELNANIAKGDVEFVIKSLASSAETFKKGDIVKISGDPQQYVLTADATVSANAITAKVYPAIKQAGDADTVVTIVLPNGSGLTKKNCLAFHRHAFALAMAPLSDMGGMLGAKVATVSDPVTNLSIRSRIWYDGDLSTVKVGLDALWGVQVLNPNMAVRAIQ